MKILNRFLFTTLSIILVSAPFWCNADPKAEVSDFFTTVSEEQKGAYRAVLKAQCELLREKWYTDDSAEGQNHLLYFVELQKREFTRLTSKYGHCRTLEEGGVPESLINNDAKNRHSGWIAIQLVWLISEDTLTDFASLVFDSSYERRMRTPWNRYFGKLFKKISDPISCDEVVLNFISRNKPDHFPIDVRANSKIYSTTNLEPDGALLLEDSSEYNDEELYPWTLLNKEEHLLVSVGFEPQASLNWDEGKVLYKEKTPMLKHMLGTKIVVNYKEQKYKFIDQKTRADKEGVFNLHNYAISRDLPPSSRGALNCH